MAGGEAYDRAEYDRTVDELKQVAAGRRGWVSLTAASRKSGVPKGQLRTVALALGLEVDESHGRHGMTARRQNPAGRRTSLQRAMDKMPRFMSPEGVPERVENWEDLIYQTNVEIDIAESGELGWTRAQLARARQYREDLRAWAFEETGRRINPEEDDAHRDIERAYDDLVDLVIATAPAGELLLNRGKEAGVTDRALRYRANADPPPGPRQCMSCGSRRNVEVGHIDGFEENNEPENLEWVCRRCNTRMGIVYARADRGRRTHQYNPAGGAKTAGQFFTALAVRHGQSSDMTLDEAIQMIHDTPHSRRSRFQKANWGTKRSLYGRSGRPGGGRDEVPF